MGRGRLARKHGPILREDIDRSAPLAMQPAPASRKRRNVRDSKREAAHGNRRHAVRRAAKRQPKNQAGSVAQVQERHGQVGGSFRSIDAPQRQGCREERTIQAPVTQKILDHTGMKFPFLLRTVPPTLLTEDDYLKAMSGKVVLSTYIPATNPRDEIG